MVDALAPAVGACSKAVAGAARRRRPLSCSPARPSCGAEATIPMQALKGRASYLGPRSVGHQDPGATSTALILGALRDVALRDVASRESGR